MRLSWPYSHPAKWASASSSMSPRAYTQSERRAIAALLLSVVEANSVSGPGDTPAEMVRAIPPAEAEQLGPTMMRLLKKTFR
jgi:hypothetical protein